MARHQRCGSGDIELQKSVCIVLDQLWLCPETSSNQRSEYMVLVKCQLVCNRNLSVLISMPFDWTSSGGMCYGAGRRRLSPGRFQKGTENRERTEKQWNQQHRRIFVKKPIYKAWERLKGSRLCERFFVYILHDQADLYSLVFFLDFGHSVRFSWLRYTLWEWLRYICYLAIRIAL